MTRLTPLISDRSPTMLAIVETIDRFHLASSSQLLKLHYTEGTAGGRKTRQNEHLRTLVHRGLIRRVAWRSTLNPYGAAEFIYTPPDSDLETLRPHMHDVTEVYVQLKLIAPDVQYDPEEWGRKQWGAVELHPDALVYLPSIPRAWFLEVDRSSERPNILAAKMNKYIRAAKSMPAGAKFPFVLFTVRNSTRMRTIKGLIRSREIPQLFGVCLLDDAAAVMTNEAL